MTSFEGLETANAILDKYYTTKYELFDLISNDETNNDDILKAISIAIADDPDCTCRFGKGNFTAKYKCINCLELSRLGNFRDGPLANIPIMTGTFSGHSLKVDDDFLPHRKVIFSEEPKRRTERLNKIHNLSSCGLRGSPVAEKYLVADDWANKTLINWMVSCILEKEKLPHVIPTENAFVCCESGYRLSFDMGELPLVDTMTELSSKDALGILKQIGVTLTALKGYQFVHGTATIDKLKISFDNGCKYTFEGHEIDNDFTLYIDGFHLSSLTVNNVRMMPSTENRGVNINVALDEFKPLVQGYEISGRKNICSSTRQENINKFGCTQDGGTYIFKTGGMCATLFTTMRYSGYPLYGGAVDTYSFLISLMSWKPFADAVERDPGLGKIWSSMFPIPTEIPDIKLEDKPITCSYVVSKLLNDKWLYCDAPERLLILTSDY